MCMFVCVFAYNGEKELGKGVEKKKKQEHKRTRETFFFMKANIKVMKGVYVVPNV